MAAALPETDSEDELPSGWEERATDDGKVYFANHAEKLTQWGHPRTGKRKKVDGKLPYGWERVVSPDTNLVVFVDHINHKTTYTDPRLAFAVEDKGDCDPIRQKYDASTTAMQVVHGKDLSGKTAIITGGNSGIGYETARTLAYHGVHVILACRNEARAMAAIKRIKHERPQATVEFLMLNLGSFTSINMFVNQVKLRNLKCHILILNAGVFGCSYNQTLDGLEEIFQTNYLSNVYLLHLLEDTLLSSQPCRVVFVTSESHRFADLTIQSINEEKLSPSTSSKFVSIYAYNNSKLCVLLLAMDLNNRLSRSGKIDVFAVHPGNMINSNISKNWWLYRILFTVVRPFTKSMQQAAATSVYAATATELSGHGGLYLNGCYACHPHQLVKDVTFMSALREISWSIINRVIHKRTTCT